MSRADLLDLRDQSREDNVDAGITGLLIYRSGVFLQDLEGPEANVQALYERIRLDPRNSDVTLIWTQFEAERRFPRWSMALAEPGRAALEMLVAADDPLDADLPEARFVRELLDLFDARG